MGARQTREKYKVIPCKYFTKFRLFNKLIRVYHKGFSTHMKVNYPRETDLLDLYILKTKFI